MSEGGDKTEEPTQKKLDDARREGSVWKSKDLSGVMAFAVAMGVVKATWGSVEERITMLFRFVFDHIAHPQALNMAIAHLLALSLATLLVLCLPIAFAAAVTGGLLEFLQVGPLLAIKALMPKLDKLNPLAGIKNMFSKKQVIELVKSIAKLSVTGYVVYGVVRDAMALVVATIGGDAGMTMTVLGELVSRVVIKVTMLFIGFAIFDVWWQHKSYMKDQMMSKDDIKKEYKESEGDPHHKAHRKQMHQEIMESGQMEAVKGADVVVTNPDHVAVALKYDRDRDGAPRVIAKGMDFKAEKLKGIAREADVPMLRNVPLAHALLRTEVNEEIPEELYDAVAEVLNFVYQLKNPPAQPATPARASLRAHRRSSVLVVADDPDMAIAIKYDREKDGAPRVVAKGMRLKAEKIREIAKAAGVPFMKNTTLAAALYRVDVGQEIPEELYDAVAEVLNFVYALQQEQGKK